MCARFIALLGVLLALSGCCGGHWGETPLPGSTRRPQIALGGRDPPYRVHKPAGLAAAAPLVVMLHGATGTGLQAENAFGWDQLADSAKFVVAYPDGIGRSWNGDGWWG